MVLGYFFSMFPARAGVILVHNKFIRINRNVPRASGGDPILITFMGEIFGCSPRERG